MNDPDLRRPPTDSDVRTLVLPGGGSIQIPMPGSKAAPSIRRASSFADADSCPHLGATVIVSVVVGVAIGATVTAWVLHRR